MNNCHEWSFRPPNKRKYEWSFWEDWLSSEECDFLVKHAVDNIENFGTATILGERNRQGFQKDSKLLDTEVRRCNTYFFENRSEDIIWFYEKLAEAIKGHNERFFGYDLNGIETVQFSNYDCEDKGFYTQHKDTIDLNFQERKLSCTIQLTDEDSYEGGDVIIYTDSFERPTTLCRKRGSITFFPSYIIHEVKPVTYGIRNSLVAWVLGPHFK